MLYAYINNYFIIFLLKSLHNRYFFCNFAPNIDKMALKPLILCF